MQMREKVGTSWNTESRDSLCFSNDLWLRRVESRLAKAAGAEAAGQMGDEKVHAVVARSTFPSENVQNTPMSDHFWKLRCRKSARRCGAKHMSKSKCTKHHMVGPLLEVAMSKKCTPLWREAHFQVKMYKTPHVRTAFGGSDVDVRKSARCCGAKHISKSKCTKHTMFGPLLEAQMSTFEKVHAVVARSTFPSQNVQNTPCSDRFWRLRCRRSKKCTLLWREAHFEVKMYKTHHVRSTFGGSDVDFRKSARRCGAKHISKSKCTKHTMFGPLLEAQMSTFEKVYAVVARSTFPSQNVKNTRVSDHFWRFSCRVASLHSKNLHYTTWHDTTLHFEWLRPGPAQQIDRWIER